MSKRDVLFLCQYFYPEYVSSATLPFDTALALSNAGMSVDALCGYPSEYADTRQKVPKKEVVQSIGIHRVGYFQTDRSSTFGRLANFLSFFLAVLLRLPKMRNYKTIAVYSNPPMIPLIAVWAKKIFGCNLVFICYDVYPEIAIVSGATSEKGILARLMRHVNKQLFTVVDSVVALSSDMRDHIISSRMYQSSKVVVIPNWYEDVSKGERCTVSSIKGIDFTSKFVVSFMGNMGRMQDLNTIIQAMIILKNAKRIAFLFAGHGSETEKLRSEIRKNNLENAFVLDFLHEDDYRNAMKLSGCSLVSLIPGLTGLCAPSKAYASMVMSKPIITIMDNNELTQDLLEWEAGIWLRNGEGEKLANTIETLSKDAEITSLMGDSARRLYEKKYTKERSLDRYHHVFSDLSKNK